MASSRRTPKLQKTLEDALINRIADLYLELVDQLRTKVRIQLQSRSTGRLRKEAQTSWRRSLEHVIADGRFPELTRHIQNEILPVLEVDDLASSVFLIFFFSDERTKLKRAWCPTDKRVLRSLGFPYRAVDSVTKGLPGIPGLSRWEVPLTHKKGKGVRGDLRHQHCADLTELQFRKRVYVPEGDWMIGIKSVIFLGVPVNEIHPTQRVGQICICSPIPNLFGRKNLWEKESQAKAFFDPYVKSVPKVVEKRPFCEVFRDCVDVRQSGASQLADAWLFQTLGLTHKHRAEIEMVDLQWCLPVEQFLRFATRQKSFQPLLKEYNRQNPHEKATTQSLLTKLASIRGSLNGHRSFYEFLRHYSIVCQRDFGLRPRQSIDYQIEKTRDTASTDPLRIATYDSFESFQKHIAEVASIIGLVRGKFGPVEWEPCVQWKAPGALLEKGAVEYILHELLVNAEKRKAKDSVIRVSASTLLDSANRNILRFVIRNELDLNLERSMRCDTCGKLGQRFNRFINNRFCDKCLVKRLRKFFEEDCWWPQKSEGFGLFVIKQFVERFYRGSLLAKVIRRDKRFDISFCLELPMEVSRGGKGERDGQSEDSNPLLRQRTL